MKLSVVLPGINVSEWPKFYHSLNRACSREFEVIIVGPYEPCDEIGKLPNVTYIKSLASPVRCMQLGAIEATGEYLSLSCEGEYTEGSVDKVFSMLDSHNKDKTIIGCKYIEGVKDKKGRHRKRAIRALSSRSYYIVNDHPLNQSPFIPDHWLLIHMHFMKTEFFREVGGLDCRFEAQAVAMTDLANRMQRSGATVHLTDFFLMDLDHIPGIPPDRQKGHGPIYFAQVENDHPLYRSIYDDPSCVNRTNIPYDNWKNAPEIWARRDF